MKTTATSRRFRPETTSPTRILGGRIGAPTIEALESRIVYSITFTGVPAWLQQGSGPIQHAQVTVPPDNFATGAVESIAVNPFNSSEIYVGTVNGGIWKTSNADPTNSDATDWIPLTDQQATLATGGIAFSTLDPTGKTVYAGTGSFSSLSSSGGPAAGLLHTTDGGATWSLGLLNPGGGEARIRTVVPTGLDLDAGPGVQEMILAGTVLGGGLYRSNDNGTTFTLLSGANGLPAGDISHVIVDPNNSQRYYAAVPNQGIYRGDYSAGTGLITWTQTTGLTGAGTAGNIQLAAHDAGASTVLFALVSGTSRGAFRSTDGAAWNPLATPPALFARDVTQRAANIMVADPTDSTVAYITTYGGGDDIFRYDASGAGSWVVIDHGGALGGTAPHADGRGLVFQTSNTLIQSDDGGIYVIQNPLNAAANAWHSYSGSGSTGLGNTEIHSVAWDSRFNVAVGGFQDNGTNVQNGTGSNVWEHFNGGDGGDVVIDATTLAGTAKTIRYISSQNLGGFSRVVFDSATNITATVGLIPAGGLAGFVGQFVNPVEINALPGLAGESVRIVIGGGTDGGNPVGAMYEANNAGVAANAAAVNWVQVPTGAGFGSVSAMAYGGTRLGVNNPDALYVGSGAGVFVRTAAAGTLNPTTSAFPGSDVTDITLDPLDWQHAFVSSSTGVWETTDAGANWTARTGDLGNSNITSIEYVEHGAVDAVLVGGLGGVYRMLTDDPGDWSEFGIGMPNAVTFDLEYNVTDDVLLAGTLGRGAWTVPSASSSLFNPGVMHLTGDADFAGENDVFRFVRDAANPQTLNIFINNNTPVPNLQVPLFALEQINVDGLGGNDTLIYDSTNGLISVASGTRYDGGTGRDALNLRQTGGVQTGDVYGIGPNNGDGSSVITGATGTQNVQFQNIEPVLDLVPSPTLVVNGSPAANAINYSAGGVVANGLVTIDNFESIEFSNKVALTINGLAGSDEISLHNGTVPTGLIGITVDGGDPTGSDRLLISGTTGADAFTFAPTSLSAGMVTGVVLPVSYLGAEHVVLAGDGGNDTFNLNGANGAVSLLGNAGADRVNFSTAAEAVVFDLDAVGVDQRVTSTDALVTLLDRLENFTGSAFNDILRLDAATFARDINGGPHTVVPPGDKLFFDGQAAVVTVTKTDANTGTIKTKGYADVTFDEFETITLDNTPSGGGFGPPGSNSNAFTDAHIYDPTTFTIGGRPAAGRGPNAVATGDLNGDGFADMVSANGKTKNISVFLNKGDGTFGEPTNFISASGPQDLVIADFDGDTNLDVAVTNRLAGNVALFLGNGAGSLGTPTFFKTPSTPFAVATDDLNGDTFADLVVTLPGIHAVAVLLGNGAGGFAAPVATKVGGKEPRDVVIGDFNADTKPDVATSNYASANVSFLQGNGAGGFAAPTLFGVGLRPTALAVGDMNNDGSLDLGVSHLVSRFVSVLFGNGAVAPATQFLPQLRVALPAFHAPNSIAIADFNGDGIADIGLGNSISTTFTILLGTGLGKFTQPYEFDLGRFPKSPKTNGIAIADLNNDGLLDVIATSPNTDDLRVLLRNV